MKIYVELDLPDTEATNVAYALEAVAEHIHNRGYTDGDRERAPVRDGPSIKYIVDRVHRPSSL